MQASNPSPRAGHGRRLQLRPVEGAFLDNPDVSNNQNTKKHQHLDESKYRQLLVKDSPREKENGLDIEDYKQNSDHVITDRISLPRIGIGIDAAFVGRQLPLTARLRPDQPRHQKRHDRKGKCPTHEKEDRYVS